MSVLFSTRCMNMMLPKMFNWYIFKIFLLLKNFPRVCKFVFIKNNMYCMFLLAVKFFKVCPAGTAPNYIGIVYVYMSSRELVRHSFPKKVWPYKRVLNFLLFCFMYI